MPAEPETTVTIPESQVIDRAWPQLQRLQRMEMVAALAGGIAHEFNNLLLAVRGNLALALTTADGGEGGAERLRQADTAAARASELSQRLMALARPGTDRPEAIDFNRVVKEAGHLATRAWRGRIALAVQPAPETPHVWMEHSLAVQVILSLCLNAGESFSPRKAGDLVTIGNEIVRLEPAHARALGRAADDWYVRCTVTDNGPGIAAETLPRLFTPFFTTKPHGTGLGLAMAQVTTRRAGGFVEATNPVAGGTTFSLLLPLYLHAKIPEIAEKKLDDGAKIF